MKKIRVKNTFIGSGMKYFGWSGRGWADGGPAGAGPLNAQAPSWDSYGQEIGINMVRMGFTIKHFLPDKVENPSSLSEQIKKGLEDRRVSWAKSEQTSYTYALQRCLDLGWKMLVCINPSYKSFWNPFRIARSSPALQTWKDFCFLLSGFIEENWPGIARYYEITNEPDIGYFDGESFLPDYQGPRRGITPYQYLHLLQSASQGIREAVPEAKIIGPGLASWNRIWLEEVLHKSAHHLDVISYHNVGGHLKDEEIIKEAKGLLSSATPQDADCVINSEWAWWPNHDINSLETAIRIAYILYLQTSGGAYGSFYLGPAQPKEFKKGLGVLWFDARHPNSIECTQSFYALRLMIRGVLGGKRLALDNPYKELKALALLNEKQELVITVINLSKKKAKKISIDIDRTLPLRKESNLKFYRFDHNHSDSCENADGMILKRMVMAPQCIIQFVLPLSHK
jgi:hypothetical protein